MTPQLANDYLEFLATGYLPIAHNNNTPRFTSTQMYSTGTPGAKMRLELGPCILSLALRYNAKGDSADNNVVGMYVAFAVIQHFETTMEPAQIVARKDQLFAHAMKLIGRIKKDQQDGAFSFLVGLKPHQVRIFESPPYFDNARGWEVQIPLDFDASEMMAFDGSEWD